MKLSLAISTPRHLVGKATTPFTHSLPPAGPLPRFEVKEIAIYITTGEKEVKEEERPKYQTVFPQGNSQESNFDYDTGSNGPQLSPQPARQSTYAVLTRRMELALP